MNRNDVIKGLECCLNGDDLGHCDDCPYNTNSIHCDDKLIADALEYIQHSEEVRADLVERMDGLLAAVKDFPDVVRCCECRWGRPTKSDRYCCHNTQSPVFDSERTLDKNWFCASGERREQDG